MSAPSPSDPPASASEAIPATSGPRTPAPGAGYRLESVAAAEAAFAAVADRFPVVPDTPAEDRLTYLDTFDWRLFGAGLTLTLRTTGEGSVLDLADAEGRDAGRAVRVGAPGFVEDLPPGALRDRLAPVVEMRRLLPVVTLSETDRRVRVVDDLEKTVARVALRTGTAEAGSASGEIPPLILCFPVRGYDQECGLVREFLEGEVGLARTGQAPLVAALEAVGRSPGDYSSKLSIRLHGGERSDEAAKKIYRALLDTIRRNEAGVAADTDSEFLHDFRVAVRRTRSALSQIRDVFPPEDLLRFKEGFRRIGEFTGPTRDLDVYLLKLPAYRESLSEGARGDLEPLREFLVRSQREEHARVAKALGSRWYADFLHGWGEFLASPPPIGAGPANAARPIDAVASESIRRTFKKLLRMGRAIDPDSPREMLHRLRIAAKKLRYLLTFFVSLYPDDAIAGLVSALKRLQDNLGDFNDYGLQQAALKGFAARMLAEGAPAETIMAMGRLVERLERGETEERERFEARFAEFCSGENRARFRSVFGGKGGKT